MSGPVQWLAAHAAATPYAPCLGSIDGWVTYGELHQRMHGIRALLAGLGVKPGELFTDRIIDPVR